MSSSDEEEHDRFRTLLVENHFLKDEQKQAAQLRLENDDLKRKMKELEEQLKREAKMRVATDAAFKSETKRLREQLKQLKRNSTGGSGGGYTGAIVAPKQPTNQPTTINKPRPLAPPPPKPRPFMPLSLLDKAPKATKPKVMQQRKQSLDDIIMPQPKKCVEALTPNELNAKKAAPVMEHETGSSIRETIRQQRMKSIPKKKRKLSTGGGVKQEEAKVPKIESMSPILPILPSSPKADSSTTAKKGELRQRVKDFLISQKWPELKDVDSGVLKDKARELRVSLGLFKNMASKLIKEKEDADSDAMANQLDDLFSDAPPAPSTAAPPTEPSSTAPPSTAPPKTPERNVNEESDALHSVFSQMKQVGQITPNLSGTRPVREASNEKPDKPMETAQHLNRAEVVDQLALSDDGSSSSSDEEELCMDIGEPQEEREEEKKKEKETEKKPKDELNDIWSASMKSITTIDQLIEDARDAEAKFIASRSDTHILISVERLNERLIIPDQWVKFIGANNNNGDIGQRRLSQEIDRLMSTLDGEDSWKVLGRIEQLVIVWLLAIKNNQGSLGDVTHVLIQFGGYVQRGEMDRVLFCGVIMWAMKLINELFTKELTLMRLVNVLPFLIAQTSMIEIGDRIWTESSEKSVDGRRTYEADKIVVDKVILKSYEVFWTQGSALTPKSLLQNAKFNHSLAGLSLMCATVPDFAETNLKKHLESCIAKFNDQMTDESGRIEAGLHELIHAIQVFDCFGRAFGQTRDKEDKKMLKGLRLLLQTYSSLSSAHCVNKTLVADHATFQLALMALRVESARKTITEHIDTLATTRKLPPCIQQILADKSG